MRNLKLNSIGYSLLFLLVPALANAAIASNSAILPDLVDKVSAGVVNISSSRLIKSTVVRGLPEFFGMFGIPEESVQKQSSLGSGFLIDSNGYILTNYHVVENASEVFVTLLDKRRIPAKIIGKDKLLDLALLQLTKGAANRDLKPTTLASSNDVRIGESVFAIGNPFGLQHTVTAGIISAKNRAIGIGPFDNFLQTDCSINFGNSGGPLFNFKGEVIGINTAINSQGHGLGFAIPIDEAKSHLSDLKNYGFISRAWLGILGETVTPAIQYYYNLPMDHGVVIARLAQIRVASSGPAIKAGLKVGDIIVGVNDQEVKDISDLQRILSKAKIGSSLQLKANRNGKNLIKEIKVTAAPDTSELPEGLL